MMHDLVNHINSGKRGCWLVGDENPCSMWSLVSDSLFWLAWIWNLNQKQIFFFQFFSYWCCSMYGLQNTSSWQVQFWRKTYFPNCLVMLHAFYSFRDKQKGIHLQGFRLLAFSNLVIGPTSVVLGTVGWVRDPSGSCLIFYGTIEFNIILYWRSDNLLFAVPQSLTALSLCCFQQRFYRACLNCICDVLNWCRMGLWYQKWC